VGLIVWRSSIINYQLPVSIVHHMDHLPVLIKTQHAHKISRTEGFQVLYPKPAKRIMTKLVPVINSHRVEHFRSCFHHVFHSVFHHVFHSVFHHVFHGVFHHVFQCSFTVCL